MQLVRETIPDDNTKRHDPDCWTESILT